jgi:DNA-binding response OmpR family regulator
MLALSGRLFCVVVNQRRTVGYNSYLSAKQLVGALKILIVEDDVRLAKPLIEELQNQHMVVNLAADGEAAWHMHQSDTYDLILLDLMLPKLSGTELCRRLRDTGYRGAIMMLTALGEKQDRINGLDTGADDYVVKPFDIDELSARIRALLRRGTSASSTVSLGRLTVDTRACTVTYDRNIVDCTPTEYRLMMNFLRNPNTIFSKHDLIEKLWSFDETPSDSVVKTHIKGLRHKLHQAGCKNELVKTVYGFGYKLNADFR